MKLGFSRQIFEKYSNIKFNKKKPSVEADFFLADGQTDTNEEHKYRFSQF